MFRFVFAIIALMFVLDVAWWIVAMRSLKSKVCRFVVSLFAVAQLAGLFSFLGGRLLAVDWLRQPPKPFFAAVVVWHFFGLVGFLAIGIVMFSSWIVRSLNRAIGLRQKQTTPANNAPSLTRREFIGAGAVLAPPLFSIGLTGIALAQLNSFRVRRFTLAIPNLPRDLDGTTMAHVSDIHVGRLTNGRVLKEIVSTTNALGADLVLLTGDLINDTLSDLSDGINIVKSMQSRYGSWMIEGNHDLFENGPEFETRVKAAGIPLLLDETASARVRGYPVQFIGLRWTRGDNVRRDQVAAQTIRSLAQQRDPDAFPILLAHHPHAFDAAAESNLPLTLSGHTHGGQIMFDSQHGFGPAMFRYWSGLYARGNSQMIVSNGVGNWFPLRINAPAEIVHLTLRRADASPSPSGRGLG